MICFRLSFLLVASFLMLLSTGCTKTFHGYYPVITTKKINGPIDFSKIPRGEKTVGTDQQQIFFIIPDEANPTVSDAIQNALDQKNGDVMLDTTIIYETKSFPFLYDRFRYTVEGTVIDSKDYIDP